jgi:hypothetical protein
MHDKGEFRLASQRQDGLLPPPRPIHQSSETTDLEVHPTFFGCRFVCRPKPLCL